VESRLANTKHTHTHLHNCMAWIGKRGKEEGWLTDMLNILCAFVNPDDFRYDLAKGLRPKRSIRNAMQHVSVDLEFKHSVGMEFRIKKSTCSHYSRFSELCIRRRSPCMPSRSVKGMHILKPHENRIRSTDCKPTAFIL